MWSCHCSYHRLTHIELKTIELKAFIHIIDDVHNHVHNHVVHNKDDIHITIPRNVSKH